MGAVGADNPRGIAGWLSALFPGSNENRRLAKDFDNLAETLASFVTLASIPQALRRLARA
jgi:hypothetical protein